MTFTKQKQKIQLYMHTLRQSHNKLHTNLQMAHLVKILQQVQCMTTGLMCHSQQSVDTSSKVGQLQAKHLMQALQGK